MKTSETLPLRVLVLLALTCQCAPVYAASHAADEAYIRHAYKVMADAFKSKDIDAMTAYISPTFSAVEPSGATKSATREQMRKAVKMELSSITDGTMRTVVNKVEFKDGGAEVHSVSDSHFLMMFHGKSATGDLHFAAVDFWKKGRSGWLVTRSQETVSDERVNGKLVNEPSDKAPQEKPK